MMIDDALRDRLSAYLDGELPPDQMNEIETLVTENIEVAAELEALSRLDNSLREAFDAELSDPVPLALVRELQAEPARPVAANLPNAPRFGMGAIAAGLALFVAGTVLGIGYSRATLEPVVVAQAQGWLDQVAEYHKVYAAQTKHLVEVPGSDPTLATWLANSTGVEATIPDLSAYGLTFQGGRLLVAAGKPVAQLMYTDANGAVVALCYVAGGDPSLGDGVSSFQSRLFDGFTMVSWKDNRAAYVVIGPEGREDLAVIAEETAIEL